MSAIQAAQKVVSGRLLATRRGTMAVGALVALLAGVVLLAYLSRYRDSVGGGGAPVSVLVARSLIERGQPGEAIGIRRLFEVATVPKENAVDLALTSPAQLRGQVAVRDIYPGEQLAVTDFTASAAAGIGASLVKDERLITIPIDTAHGLIGRIVPGDRVDVYAGFNLDGVNGGRAVLRLVMQDIRVEEVLGAGSTGVGGSSGAGQVSLRLKPAEAAKVAFASDNGRVWLVLRPRSGAKPVKPSLVTVESLLAGTRPLR